MNGNVYTDNQNGTILLSPYNTDDLKITFIPIPPGDPDGGTNVVPTEGEGAWTMDDITGTLTQGVPNEATGFTGNSNGTYGITICLTDANNNAGTGDYAAMSVCQNVMITLGYVPVNPEVISPCLLEPTPTDANVLYNINSRFDFTNEVWVPSNPPVYYSTSGIFYLANTAGGNLNLGTQDTPNLPGQIMPDADDSNLQLNGQPAITGNPNTNPNSYNAPMLFKSGDPSADNPSHTQGTIVLTLNAWLYDGNSVPAFLHEFTFWNAKYYYRIQDESNGFQNEIWLPIPRELEYNRVGSVLGDGSFLKTPARDNPFFGAQNPTNPGIVPWQIDNLNRNSWYQAVRAFDYADFNTEGKIEYAVVVENFRELSQGAGGGLEERAICWLTTDDLHFPSCVPWQGQNIVTINNNNNPGPAFPSFTYYRSEPKSGSVGYEPVDTSLVLYAETPYGDYVNQFYTDFDRNDPYRPVASTGSYINYTLNEGVGDLSTLIRWTDKVGNTLPPLQWIAGFEEADGIRITNPDTDIGGVNSVQTTVGVDYTGTYDGRWAGTLRIVTGGD